MKAKNNALSSLRSTDILLKLRDNYRVAQNDNNYARNSFLKHVDAMVQQGYNEVDAIQAWMQHVAEQKRHAVEAG
ncbi:MAG: hypothetical protein PUP92_19815 [Rhizonema sp. PD38]|nr:hypothetical protein [Rhizonema sp. PD38]